MKTNSINTSKVPNFRIEQILELYFWILNVVPLQNGNFFPHKSKEFFLNTYMTHSQDVHSCFLLWPPWKTFLGKHNSQPLTLFTTDKAACVV